MMARRLRAKCGGKTHLIVINDDGTVEIPSHPSIETIKAFTSFGARPPRCYRVYEALNWEPLEVISFGSRLTGQLRLLAIDYIDHALMYLSNEDPAMDETMVAIIKFAREYYTTPYRRRRADKRLKYLLPDAQMLARELTRTANCRGDLELENIEDRVGGGPFEVLEPGSLAKPVRQWGRWHILPRVAPLARDPDAVYRAYGDSEIAYALRELLSPSRKARVALRDIAGHCANAAGISEGYAESWNEVDDRSAAEREWQNRELLKLVAKAPPRQTRVHVPARWRRRRRL
jgi:hypothetical protein